MLGAVAASAAALGASAPIKPENFDVADLWHADQADAPRAEHGEDYRFFSAAEAALMARLVDRIIPPDELGPGAHEAGVTFFLDRQLAGDYGRATSMYMTGPWPTGTASQGYQTRLTPAGLYRAAIPRIDAWARSKHGRSFAELSAEQQDAIVGQLENKEVDLGGVPRDLFFTMLLQNVTEGYFSDPLYGGNRNMAGWKMIGFPGAHYDYRPYIAEHNKKLDIAPAGILGAPDWKPRR